MSDDANGRRRKAGSRHAARLRHAAGVDSLTKSAVRLYLLLASFADFRTGVLWPGIDRLAAELKVIPRTVERAMEELTGAGLLATVKPGGGRKLDGKGRTTRRKLLDPPPDAGVTPAHADGVPRPNPGAGALSNPGASRHGTPAQCAGGTPRNTQGNTQHRRRGGEREAGATLTAGPAAGAAAGGDEHGGRSGGRLAEAAAVLDARGVCEPPRTELLDLLAAAADAEAGPNADAARTDALAAAGLRAVADATDGGPGLVVIRVRERGAAAVAEAAARLAEREAAAARVTSGSAAASREASANAAVSRRVLAAFGLAPADLAAAVPADWHAARRGTEAIHPLVLACVLSSMRATGGSAGLADSATATLMRSCRNGHPDVLLNPPERVRAATVGAMLHAGLLPPGPARLTEGGTVAVVGHAVGPDVPAAEVLPLLMSTLDATAAERAAYAAAAARTAEEGAAP